MMLRLKLQQPHHVKRVNLFSHVTIEYLIQISLEFRGMHVKVKNLNGGSHLYSWGRQIGFSRQCSPSFTLEYIIIACPTPKFIANSNVSLDSL